jgi:hypothetical protein
MGTNTTVGLSYLTYNILIQDIHNFKCYKKDHTINKNLFFNRLISSYCDDVASSLHQRHSKINDIILQAENTLLKESTLTHIDDYLIQESEAHTSEKLDHHVSISLNKVNLALSEKIEKLIAPLPISTFFRFVFNQYVALRQDERERILFKDEIELIQRAIDTKRSISMDLGLKTKVIISPYKFLSTKHHLYYYIIGTKEESFELYNIHKISNIKILNSKIKISSSLEKTIKAQLSTDLNYGQDKYINCKVVLTEEGVKRWERFYQNRPEVEKIEGNEYYFYAPTTILYTYFLRFLEDAYVAYPASLQRKLKLAYGLACKVYSNLDQS